MKALVELNTVKNLAGSAMAGAMGGFNAHAGNIVVVVFITTGQDPVQNVESSQCITKMEAVNDGKDLHVSVTMPSIVCVSRYEGDLVARCYYAKHKLVWEVLDGGLKSKIEVQWSDITALKANCSENGPGTLDIVLARQPLFFKETNPQPRKHTLWQATSDFTKGNGVLGQLVVFSM